MGVIQHLDIGFRSAVFLPPIDECNSGLWEQSFMQQPDMVKLVERCLQLVCSSMGACGHWELSIQLAHQLGFSPHLGWKTHCSSGVSRAHDASLQSIQASSEVSAGGHASSCCRGCTPRPAAVPWAPVPAVQGHRQHLTADGGWAAMRWAAAGASEVICSCLCPSCRNRC